MLNGDKVKVSIRMSGRQQAYADRGVETENAFAKRLKSFIEIGAFPEYLVQHAIELGPVDLCADATIKILQNKVVIQ